MGVLPKLIKEAQGKDYNMIMVIVNKLIKYAYFEPTITNAIAPEIAKIFMEKVII
jgi:hypothetical protein